MSMPFPVAIQSGTTISEWYALHSGGNTMRIPIDPPIVGPCNILMLGDQIGVYDCDGDLITTYVLNGDALKPKKKETSMTYLHREWVHVDDGTPCNFLASTPTVPDTEGSNWCCQDHVRKIQAVNWPVDQMDGIEAAFDSKYWEKQYRDLAEAYQTASTAADHFRAALCAFLELKVNPGDAELICQLNWAIAARKRSV